MSAFEWNEQWTHKKCCQKIEKQKMSGKKGNLNKSGPLVCSAFAAFMSQLIQINIFNESTNIIFMCVFSSSSNEWFFAHIFMECIIILFFFFVLLVCLFDVLSPQLNNNGPTVWHSPVIKRVRLFWNGIIMIIIVKTMNRSRANVNKNVRAKNNEIGKFIVL